MKCRVNARSDIYLQDANRLAFIQILEDACRQFNRENTLEQVLVNIKNIYNLTKVMPTGNQQFNIKIISSDSTDPEGGS